MKINIISVGTKMPAWVEAGVEEYRKRLPAGFTLNFVEVPLARRGARRGSPAEIEKAVIREGEALLGRTGSDDHVVALEVKGRSLSTEALARHISELRESGSNLSLLIGGPDGLSEACRRRASEQWSLSALTMPHPLVRVVLAEQIYRVWSLLHNHPYHRA